MEALVFREEHRLDVCAIHGLTHFGPYYEHDMTTVHIGCLHCRFAGAEARTDEAQRDAGGMVMDAVASARAARHAASL